MNVYLKRILCFGCFFTMLVLVACNTSSDAANDIKDTSEAFNTPISPSPIIMRDVDDSTFVETIVPEKETLVKNLEDAGYTITTYTSIDGSDLTIDRIYAEKDSAFIDITYCFSSEEANEIFAIYYNFYYGKDLDYHNMARNGNCIYYTNDETTFLTAGFTSPN